jgi:PAS domain S-box-containing protein
MHDASHGNGRDQSCGSAPAPPTAAWHPATAANLLSALGTGALILDAELRLQAFNSAALACFPLTQEDRGRLLQDLPCELADARALRDEADQALRGGAPAPREMQTALGACFLAQVRPISGQNGHVVAIVLSFTDRGELARMRQRFDLALQSVNVAWWEWDITTDRLSLHNSGWCPFDAPLGGRNLSRDSFMKLVHPEERDAVGRGLDASLRGEISAWDCEHRFHQKDDSWIWVCNRGRVVERDSSGRPVRMVGTTQNIAARKEAEASVARDLDLLAHVPDAVICVDVRGIVTYWNRAATLLYGWHAQETLGLPLAERFPEHARDQFSLLLAESLEGRDYAGEFKRYRKDGACIWVDARSHRLLGPDGQMIGVMKISRDVTEARRLREQRALMERQLAQSQKMETLGNLAGGIAHDFNNMLAAILGYAEIATDLLPEGHPALAKLANVRQAGQRAAELVRRILAFSRANDQPRRAVRVAQLIEETLPLLRASLPSTIEIRSVVTPDADHLVLGDYTQLQQVLLNVCANAAHAIGDHAGGRLDVRLEPTEIAISPPLQVGAIGRGPALVLTLADNGCGMEPDVIARIFEPFFTTKPIGEGTGLGLSITHSIVIAHSGGIRVESAPGQGSVFRVYLPALPESFAESACEGGAHLPALALPAGRGERVAVIDDEETVALLTQQVLERYGYAAEIMPDAPTCLAEMRAQPDAFALVVTDQTMPLMTGLELVQAMRADGLRTPVLLLSGYSRAFAPERLAGLGRVGFLAKPFVVRDLLERVHAIVNRPAETVQTPPTTRT